MCSTSCWQAESHSWPSQCRRAGAHPVMHKCHSCRASVGLFFAAISSTIFFRFDTNWYDLPILEVLKGWDEGTVAMRRPSISWRMSPGFTPALQQSSRRLAYYPYWQETARTARNATDISWHIPLQPRAFCVTANHISIVIISHLSPQSCWCWIGASRSARAGNRQTMSPDLEPHQLHFWSASQPPHLLVFLQWVLRIVTDLNPFWLSTLNLSSLHCPDKRCASPSWTVRMSNEGSTRQFWKGSLQPWHNVALSL